MPDSPQSVLAALGGDVRQLSSDMAEMLAARRQLAALEIRADIDSTRRLAYVGGAGLASALAGLPVLAVLSADALAAWLGHDPLWWRLGLGAGLLVVGLMVARVAWTRWRREFVGLKESIAELAEDVRWLREWTGQSDR